MDGTKQNTIEGPSKSPAKLPWSVQNSRYCPFSCPQDASPPTSRYLPTLNLPCFHHSETPFPLTSQGWLRTGDSESHGEGLGVAFLNINMHNSVAGKLPGIRWWAAQALHKGPGSIYLLKQTALGKIDIWAKLNSHFIGNRWGNSGNSVKLYFLGSKITTDGNWSHEMKRCLLLGKIVMTNLDIILKAETLLCQQRSI